MSHFVVGVLIDTKNQKTLGDLLAPYRENNMNDCPKQYLEFFKCEEDYEEEYKKYKDEYDNLDDFMYQYYGCKKDEKTGTYGYWENPNAKWDWYDVGGRWEGLILNKDGERVNFARLKDIDWKTMREEAMKEAEKIWDSEPQSIERYFAGIKKDDTRDSFIKRESEFTTYAVITSDGEWHSKGEMYQFGISSETTEESNDWSSGFYNRFIKDSDQDLILVIVDCHI